MATKRKFKNDVSASIHASASALHKVGAIDKATMRHFDESCVAAPADIKPTQIKHLREQSHMSQPVFALHLNVSESTVKQWESGAKKPGGSSLKLLDVVRKHGLAVLT